MNIIKSLIEQNNLTAYKLSKETGVSEAAISRIINNKTDLNKVSVGVLYKIAKTLNVPMEYLLTQGALKFDNTDDKLRVDYITEIHALNLCCPLETNGDLHQSALDWNDPYIRKSWESVFGDYGLYWNIHIPKRKQGFYVADHIRACLDLLDAGKFGVLQGMNKNYIDNDKYNEDIFTQVYKLRFHPNWKEIYRFMHKEYGRNWRVWINEKQAKTSVTGSDFTIRKVCNCQTAKDKRLAFGEFLNCFHGETDSEKRTQMIVDEPEYDITDRTFMAEMASAVHKLSNDNDLVCPEWVFSKKYYLNKPVYAFDTVNEDYQKYLRDSSPKEYAERNIFLGDNVLKKI